MARKMRPRPITSAAAAMLLTSKDEPPPFDLDELGLGATVAPAGTALM
jgi:hypothetical protein